MARVYCVICLIHYVVMACILQPPPPLPTQTSLMRTHLHNRLPHSPRGHRESFSPTWIFESRASHLFSPLRARSPLRKTRILASFALFAVNSTLRAFVDGWRPLVPQDLLRDFGNLPFRSLRDHLEGVHAVGGETFLVGLPPDDHRSAAGGGD